MEKIKYILGDKDHAKEIQQYFAEFDKNVADYYNFEYDNFAYFISPNERSVDCFTTDEWQFKALVESGVFEELKYPYGSNVSIQKPKLKVIQGVPNRGSEVIALLESIGGRNADGLKGCYDDTYYYIDIDGFIYAEYITNNFFNHYDLEILTLPSDVTELEKVASKPKLQVIRGDWNRGNDVIKLLMDLGGNNSSSNLGIDSTFYYYLNSDKVICCTNTDNEFFKSYDLEFLTLPDVDSRKEFEPFVSKVLVRVYSDSCWIPALYFSKESEGDNHWYHIVGSPFSYNECIPYEGNEQLAFATINPELNK